jgi:hypothetical protein
MPDARKIHLLQAFMDMQTSLTRAAMAAEAMTERLRALQRDVQEFAQQEARGPSLALRAVLSRHLVPHASVQRSPRRINDRPARRNGSVCRHQRVITDMLTDDGKKTGNVCCLECGAVFPNLTTA